MNIVFWLIVVVALAVFWFCMRFVFREVGGTLIGWYDEVKGEISGHEGSETSDEEKEKTNE